MKKVMILFLSFLVFNIFAKDQVKIEQEGLNEESLEMAKNDQKLELLEANEVFEDSESLGLQSEKVVVAKGEGDLSENSSCSISIKDELNNCSEDGNFDSEEVALGDEGSDLDCEDMNKDFYEQMKSVAEAFSDEMDQFADESTT